MTPSQYINQRMLVKQAFVLIQFFRTRKCYLHNWNSQNLSWKTLLKTYSHYLHIITFPQIGIFRSAECSSLPFIMQAAIARAFINLLKMVKSNEKVMRQELYLLCCHKIRSPCFQKSKISRNSDRNIWTTNVKQAFRYFFTWLFDIF